jgi:hypothetical protein
MLTDLACRKAKARDKDYKLADQNGLYLFVTTTGFKSWRWKYRFAKKEKRLVFGSYPEMTIAEARAERSLAAQELAQGKDPAAERAKRMAAAVPTDELTLRAQVKGYVAEQSHRWSPEYSALVLRQFENDIFPKLGARRIDGITTPEILEVLKAVEKRGARETAHRLRSKLSDVYARAIASHQATTDPAAVTRKAIGRPRKGRFPAVRTIEAARAVLVGVEQQAGYPLTRLASRLLALTVARSGVLRFAERHEFEDLDGDLPLWRVPPAKMKLTAVLKSDLAMEFVIPLSRQAVETVKVAMAWSAGSKYLFRGVKDGNTPISDNTLSKLYRDAGYQGIHVPHGWRSTFSTITNEIAEENERDGDRAIIDLMLAHVPKGTEATYNRAAYMKRRRELAQDWADRLTDGLPEPETLLAAKPPR